MRVIMRFFIALVVFKIVLFLIAKGFALDIIERFYENNKI